MHNKHTYHSARVSSSPSLRAGRVLSAACMAIVAVFAILTMRDESALRAALVQTQNRITEIKDRKKTESSPSGIAQVGPASARTLSSSVSLTAATPDVRQMLIRRTQRLQERLVQSGVSPREAAGIAAASALSSPLAGRDGQVLMLKNGKEVWITLTDLDIVQSDPPSRHAPYSTEGGEWRNYGGGNPTSTSVSGGSNIDLPLNILRDTTGILGYNRGGTGIDSYSSGDLLVGLQAGNLGKISLGDAGFVLTSSGGSPRWMSAASVAAAGGWIDDGSVVRLLTAGDSVGIGTVSPDAKLDVIGTISGSTLAASTLLRSSGGLVVENGNISVNGVVYSFTSSQGGVNTFLKNDGAGALTWSTLPPGFGSGQVITIGDPRFVNASGDTMTGALVIQNGSTHAATSTPLLNVRGTMSGKLLWITGTGSLPLLSTVPQTGTVMFGTGGFKQMGASIFPVLGSAPRPKIAGSVATGANPFGIAVADHYAYVVNGGDNTLQIYDLTNPTAPVSLGSVGTRAFPYSVTVQGRYAYVTTFTTATSSLQIFDVSNPSAPTVVGFVSTAANPVRVAVAGRYAYVVTEGTERLHIIDVSNPASPEIVASPSLDFEGPSSLAVAGNYVYTSDSVNGAMIIFDVSNPKSPRRVSNTFALSQPQDIVVQGRYAYIAAEGAGRLQIFDISNPASPTSVSWILAGGNIQKLAIAGRYVYALRQGSTGLQVFDVSNPASPVDMGVFPTGTAPSGIALSGRYAYIVNDSSATLQVYDLGGAYLNAAEIGSLESTSISVADTLNARSITARSSLQVGQGGLQVQGPSAFMNTSTGAYALQILSGTGGLRIAARTSAQAHITFGTGTTFDTSLWRKGASILKTNGTFEAAAFSGRTLYISGSGSGLSPLIATDLRYGTIMMGTGAMKNGSGSITAQLYVTGKINPTPVGSLNTGLVGAIALQGRTLFVGSQFSSNVGVYDVTNPQNIGSYSPIAAANHVCVAVQGKYLYSSHYRNGTFRIVDISDPASPVLKGSLTDTTGAACASILVQGNYLYEVNTDQIFQVYDISDPNAPKIIKTYTMTQDMSGSKMAFLGKDIVISGNGLLIVLDVSNPRNPVQVGSALSANGIAAIDIQNKYGYLGRNSTFFVYDFSNPASPVQMSSVTVSGTPNAMVAQGRYVYAAFTGGLYVFDVSNPRIPVQIQFISTVVPTYMKVQGRYLYTNDASGVVRIFDLGGAYVQQLEAGGIETNDLAVRNGLRALNADIAGGLSVGAGLQVQGPSSFLSTSTGSTALRITSTYSGALVIAARGTSAAPHIIFGTGNTFDVKLWRAATNVLQTNANFYARNFSGAQLNIAGSMSGRSLYVTGTGAGVSPLIATDNRFGAILMGTGALRAGGSGSMAPQLYVTGRTGSGALKLAGSIGTSLSSPIYVAVQGKYAYVTNTGNNTLAVFDISIPTSPILVGSTTTGLSLPYGVSVQGQYAYVISATNSSLVIFNISNPASPVFLSSVSTNLTTPYYVSVQGQYAYVTNSAGASDKLAVFDVSNPSAPFFAGSIKSNLSTPTHVVVQGRYAYVTNQGANRLNIFDISNPANPIAVGSSTTGLSAPYASAVQGRYAYVASNGNNKLAIFDISNPASPALVGSTTQGLSGPQTVAVQGRYAYVASYTNNSIVVFDVSNPSTPVFLSSSTAALSHPNSVFAQGRYAYVASSGNSKLVVFDLGGAYIQALEAGGIEANDLSVTNGLRALSGDFRGGVTIAQGLQAQGPSSFLSTSTGSIALKITGTYSGALMIAARGTPAAPHIIFGTGTLFDVKLWRSASGTLATNGSLGIGTGANVLARATIFTDDTFNQPALLIKSKETTSTKDMFRIVTDYSTTNNLVYRITASGATYADAPYNSAGADYAEYFPSDPYVRIPGGKAVCLDAAKENQVKVCDREADPNIIGITSIKPSVVGNAVAGSIINDLGLAVPGYTLVGLIGQLDATGTATGSGGAIKAGDSLTSSSIPGFLRKALPGESTVGVALTNLSSGQGPIRVLIARSNKSLTVEAVEQRVSQSVANLKVDDQIKASLEKTLGESSFDQRIASAVSSQVASLLPLKDRVLTLEESIADLRSQLSASNQKPITSDLTLTGSLAANTLSAEETLTVGRDARIGGDLFLEGALIMTGDASFGTVTTGKLTAASGSTIDGTLTIAGDLLLGKNLTLASGSTLTAGQLIVANAFFVRGPVTIDGLATFFGNVDIKGELKVSSRQAGYALVKAGETKVTVHFDPPFTAIPVVTASPDIPVLYAVSKATATGFTIRLKAAEIQDITFSYTALTTVAPHTASGSFAETPVGSIMFPLDAQGVPVSSSSIWNACIRHQQPLDPVTGQPFSCTRYTPDLYIWTHPDFPNMTFVWNDSYTPALLVLPDGYVSQIVTTSSSSSSSDQASSANDQSSSSSDASSSDQSISSDVSSSSDSSSSVSSSESSASSESSSSDASSSVSTSSSSSDSSSSASSDSSSSHSSSSEGSSSSQ